MRGTETGSASRAAPHLRYRRVLLKLSGEALMGESSYGIDSGVLHSIATEIRDVSHLGLELASGHRRRQHLPRRAGARPPGPTAPPATTWACWRR